MNAQTTTANETELDAYISLIAEAGELLEQLTAYVTDHGGVSPDYVSQNDVNRMAGMVARLRFVKQYVGI